MARARFGHIGVTSAESISGNPAGLLRRVGPMRARSCTEMGPLCLLVRGIMAFAPPKKEEAKRSATRSEINRTIQDIGRDPDCRTRVLIFCSDQLTFLTH